ncbi:MAG: preprotein translocase subunit YajC [Crocinitomicaceae bacterium]|nr:preprotein translocase subunit YajC [Crocinitomicaceae bacterium]
MQLIIMLGGMFLIMYFFMIRPQMKKMKEAKKFQESISVGDRIVTLGGIHGEVIEIGDKDIVIKIDQGRMRIEKAALSPDRKVAEATK